MSTKARASVSYFEWSGDFKLQTEILKLLRLKAKLLLVRSRKPVIPADGQASLAISKDWTTSQAERQEAVSLSDQAESMKEFFPLEHRGGAVGALSGSKSGMWDHKSHPRSIIKSWSQNHFAGALNSLPCITGTPLCETSLQQRMPTSNRHILRFHQKTWVTS